VAFDYNGSSDVSKSTGSPVSATAFTLAGWIYSDTTSGSHYAFGVQNSANANGWRIGFNSTALILQCTGASTVNTQSAGNAAAGSWIHLGMVCSSATSRGLYKNGSLLTTGTSSLTPSGINQIRIGAGSDNSGNAGSYWDGGISLVGLWNAALTTAEMGELASGQHPFLVRPASLVALYLDASTAVTTGSHIGGYALDGVPAERAQRPAVFFPGWSGGKLAVPVINSYTLTCTSRSATGTSNSAILTTARLLTATSRTATGTSNAAILSAGRSLIATARTAAGTVNAATLTATRTLSCTSRTSTGTSNAATITTARTLVATTNTATATVQTATLSSARLLTATSQTATGTPQSATLFRSKVLTCTSRTATGTSNDATLSSARKIVATTGTATGTINSATLDKGYSVTLSSGSATGTVQTATLRKTYLLECIVNAAIGTANEATITADRPEHEYAVLQRNTSNARSLGTMSIAARSQTQSMSRSLLTSSTAAKSLTTSTARPRTTGSDE